MTTIPTPGEISQQKAASGQQTLYEALRSVLGEMPGGDPTSTLTLSTDAITPTTGLHAVDTEGQVAQDDLTQINNTTQNTEGRIIGLYAANAARAVTVKSGGNILTKGPDFDLTVDQPTLFQRVGTNWAVVSGPPRMSVVTYTSPGSHTWTKKDGLKYIEIEVQAAGAGGGGTGGNVGNDRSGGGGGAGGYGYKTILASNLGATEAVEVGAGGVGGVGGGANPTDGGNSSFGSHVVSTGGVKGTNANTVSAAGGAGRSATGGDVNIEGQDGHYGALLAGGAIKGGSGGDSQLGKGGTTGEGNGSGGHGYGSGGSGGARQSVSATSTDGANGRPGIVIVREYY